MWAVGSPRPRSVRGTGVGVQCPIGGTQSLSFGFDAPSTWYRGPPAGILGVRRQQALFQERPLSIPRPLGRAHSSLQTETSRFTQEEAEAGPRGVEGCL